MQQPPADLKPIYITGGDPAGISPEILIGIAESFRLSPYPIVYLSTSGDAHKRALIEKLDRLKITHSILTFESLIENPPLNIKTLFYYIDVADRMYSQNKDVAFKSVVLGTPSRHSGLLSFEALRLVCSAIKVTGTAGLLTLPLSKEHVALSVAGFHGHTDYLAEEFQSSTLMLMHGQNFSVIPITVHVPLALVSSKLKEEIESGRLIPLLQKLRATPLYQKGAWGLCALNPHAGDGGAIGREEIDYLNRFAKELNENSLPVDGPVSADALFQKEIRKHYRLILTCYHDQGLIPFKALEGEQGTNITIGLTFPRSSPDHGTAFSIAGKGIASSVSTEVALKNLLHGEFYPAEQVI